jgi:hypothetical protein
VTVRRVKSPRTSSGRKRERGAITWPRPWRNRELARGKSDLLRSAQALPRGESVTCQTVQMLKIPLIVLTSAEVIHQWAPPSPASASAARHLPSDPCGWRVERPLTGERLGAKSTQIPPSFRTLSSTRRAGLSLGQICQQLVNRGFQHRHTAHEVGMFQRH